MKLSSEQQAIINCPNKNMIVSAQAGAGKSSVMVKRIVDRIVIDASSIDQLLVITFTKKAAFEMKAKIRQELRDRLSGADLDLKRKIYGQLNLLNSANIQTVHAFCYETIRKYFEFLKLDPDVKILDGRQLEEIRNRALEECMDKLYGGEFENRDQMELFVECYGDENRRDDKNIKDLILAYADICSAFEDPVKASNAFLQEIYDKDFFLQLEKDFINDFIYPLLKKTYDDIFEFEKVLELGGPEKTIAQQKAEAESLKSFLFASKGRPEEETFKDLAENRQEELINLWTGHSFKFAFPRFDGGPRKVSDDIREKKDRIKKLRDLNKANVSAIAKLWETSLSYNHQRQDFLIKSHMRALADLFLEYYQKFMAYKKEAGGLDFNDIEYFMLKLLRNEEIREKLRNRYQYIFFDEYQDANAKQELIVDRLANPGGLFFVGDLKQCIYAFRQAVPENFKARYNSYRDDEDAEALSMSLNFRAGANILDFINRIFIPLMTEKRGGLDYDDPIHRAKSGFDEMKKKNKDLEGENEEIGDRGIWDERKGFVELALLRRNKKNKDSDNYLDRLSPEAYYVLNQIRAYVKKGGSYGDCNILSRTNDSLRDFEKIFQAYKIPFVSDRGNALENSLEYQIILNFLSFLDNIKRDIPLLSSMLSFLGGFTDEEIAKIRIADPDSSFYAAFLKMRENQEPEYRQIREKIENLLSLRNRYRDKLKEMPLDDWINYIFEDSAFYIYVKGLKNSRARTDILNQISELAGLYAKSDKANLSGFIDYLSLNEGQGGEKSIAPGNESENAVRLMTIHQSKGLTLPIVFLVDANRANRLANRAPALIYSDNYAPALNLRDMDSGGRIIDIGGLQRQLALIRQKESEDSEQIRVLYVALTRAVKGLYIVGSLDKLYDSPKKGKDVESLDLMLDKAESYMAMIYRILSGENKEFCDGKSFDEIFSGLLEEEQDLYGENELEPSTKVFDKVFFNKEKNLSFVVKDELVTRDEAGDIDYQLKTGDPYPKFDPKKMKKLWRIEKSWPLKMTVSEISQKNNILDGHFEDWPDFRKKYMADKVELNSPANGDRSTNEQREMILEKELKAPAFIKKEGDFRPEELGTLIHRAFSLLPLKEYKKDQLEEALKGLENSFFFTKEERQAIDSDLLLNFYNSALGKRIIANKDRVERERSFTLKYRTPEGHELLLDGQIDLFIELDDQIILLDFKTDRKRRPEKYRKQLLLYKRALEASYKKKVSHAYLYWLRLQMADDLS